MKELIKSMFVLLCGMMIATTFVACGSDDSISDENASSSLNEKSPLAGLWYQEGHSKYYTSYPNRYMMFFNDKKCKIPVGNSERYSGQAFTYSHLCNESVPAEYNYSKEKQLLSTTLPTAQWQITLMGENSLTGMALWGNSDLKPSLVAKRIANKKLLLMSVLGGQWINDDGEIISFGGCYAYIGSWAGDEDSIAYARYYGEVLPVVFCKGASDNMNPHNYPLLKAKDIVMDDSKDCISTSAGYSFADPETMKKQQYWQKIEIVHPYDYQEAYLDVDISAFMYDIWGKKIRNEVVIKGRYKRK